MFPIRPVFLFDPMGIGDSIQEWIQEWFNPTAPVENAISIWNGFMNLIVEFARTNPYSYTVGGNSMMSIVSGVVGDGIKAIATSILVLVWMIGFLRSASRINSPMHDPMEIPMKLIRLIITEGIIMSYDWIISLIFDLGTAAINAISPTATYNMELADIDILETGNIGAQILMWIMGLAFCANVLFAGIKAALSVFGRLLKIYIVIFLAPIALAFYASERTEQNAMKYLEGVGSLSLQAVVIVLAVTVYTLLATNLDLSTITIYFSFGESAQILTWFVGQFFLVNLLLAILSASDQISERFL